MPLDDDVKRFLEEQARTGAPAPWEVPLKQARDFHRSRHLEYPEQIAVTRAEDRVVEGSSLPVPVRIYWPSAGSSGLRTVIYFHGGGFVFGDLDTQDLTGRRLARDSGSLVISVDYPLAPEHPYPAAVENSEAAVRRLVSVLAELGGDLERLVLAGDSAGANLAAVVARRLRDRGKPLPAGQLLIYPVTDFRDSAHYRSRKENARGYGLTEEAMGWYGRNYLPGPSATEDPDASPLAAEDLSGLPAAFVLTAEFDPLRDEGNEYARRLREAGVAVEHHQVAGTIHGILTNPEPLRTRELTWRLLTEWLRRF